MQINTFNNGDSGADIRAKLNNVIGLVSVAGRDMTASGALLLADEADLVRVTSASAVSVTLPADFPAGYSTLILHMGAGTVNFVAASGATRNSRGNVYNSAGQYSMIPVVVATNVGGNAAAWIIGGDLA